jgi:very-short-patch-repair endonuclease
MADTPPNLQERDQRVLVVVMNNARDMALLRERGWYRIPVKRAPAQVAADFLAFYQTGAFPEEKWTIRYYAPVHSYHLTTRQQLLPEEAGHPRARELYYRIELGALQTLPLPIVSRHLRRITFIPTTMQRLLAAREINDLWLDVPAAEKLWVALAASGLDAEHQYEIQEGRASYSLDMALFCRSGKIAIECATSNISAERALTEGWALLLQRQGWSLLRLEAEQLERPDDCVKLIRERVIAYGGLDLAWRDNDES